MDDSALIVNLAEKAKETASEVSRHRGPMSLNVIVDNQRLSPNGSAGQSVLCDWKFLR